MSKDFYTTIAGRRSIYGISKEVIVSESKIEEVVSFAVKHTPSAFNSHVARVVLLLHDQHERFWNITKEITRKNTPAERFASKDKKITGFRNGYGTVLFFEDQNVVESMQKRFPKAAHKFPKWSLQSSGMLQFIVWSGLESEGLGASLQHYNEEIEEMAKKEWSLPSEWKLLAQIPFGKPTDKPGEKEFNPLEERFFIFK